MTNGARVGLLVGTLVALVLAFVLLSPSADDESNTATAPATPSTTAPAGPDGESTPATTAVTPPPSPPPPGPALSTVRVRGGKPVGGLKTIEAKKGDQVRIRVSSTDTSDEIHLHGYDKYANVAPNKPARFAFKANAEGIFEIELHGTGTQIAKLVVEPS